MKKVLFECENEACKAQGISIFEVKIEVQKQFLPTNGDAKPPVGPSHTATFQVCSPGCAGILAEKTFSKACAPRKEPVAA